MIGIINRSLDPYFNLAMEEHLVKNWSGPHSYFVLWQNQPAVIVGRNQNTIEEINQAFIEGEDIKVVRRMSGGGAVYHDLGNINYTLVVNENNDFANFEKFTRPVIAALDKIGVQAENQGRNDITISGRKFSGNAQFMYKGRLLHHGTILFDSNLEIMARALNPQAEKISSQGIKSVRSRVTNISEHLLSPVSVEEFKQILTTELLALEGGKEIYELAPSDLKDIERMRDDKYSAWYWNYGKSPAYDIRKTASFDWGHMDIQMAIKGGLIVACRIYGDYFAARDVEELEQGLIGTEYRRDDIETCLNDLGLARFFPHITARDFARLLTGQAAITGGSNRHGTAAP